MNSHDASRPQAKAIPFQKAVTPSFFRRLLNVNPMPFPETCILVLIVSIGWVKLTVNTHEAPPSAMDWTRLGLLGSDIFFRGICDIYAHRSLKVRFLGFGLGEGGGRQRRGRGWRLPLGWDGRERLSEENERGVFRSKLAGEAEVSFFQICVCHVARVLRFRHQFDGTNEREHVDSRRGGDWWFTCQNIS